MACSELQYRYLHETCRYSAGSMLCENPQIKSPCHMHPFVDLGTGLSTLLYTFLALNCMVAHSTHCMNCSSSRHVGHSMCTCPLIHLYICLAARYIFIIVWGWKRSQLLFHPHTITRRLYTPLAEQITKSGQN